MSSLNILIIDDEVNIRKTLGVFMESRGHKVSTASNAQSAMEEAARHRFDLALVDLRLGTESGLDLIPSMANAFPWMKLVVITAYATVETAVEAMKRGATDYITKPFDFNRLDHMIARIASFCEMEKRLTPSSKTGERKTAELEIESREPSMQRALGLARQVAASEAVVLIRGMSGTGKTVLARSIHLMSKRAKGPFGVISCPTLSRELLESELFGHVKGAFTGALRDNPGRIAACEGGTLFFDEIGDLPLAIQPKLLRFIQEREYERVGDQHTRKADVRIIAATNTDLEEAVREGRFREDLYYRLNVVPIELPSLAERPADIEPLALSLLAFFSAENRKSILGFSDEALAIFRSYPWPGNIRELRNVIERAVILCNASLIDVDLLPESLRAKKTSLRLGDPVTLDIIEEQHIRKVLAETASLQEAATILGIDQATLWRKRKQLGIP
ncbi:sigma-54-dependent Fis family transcriptional regulator [Chlorobaculum thiosulfatiphilum]|uniref:Sigma-54-dependent Fis family transcriptional regulator n=1 Tax=Chlorobaculum thiosulfatiphilum TaxID=115852 RepID=A0A5C4S704_CHLTI|nr:sigma-54 dependent transcriptional regulator [Chlorobaculum thiosulfatiphilum]TNJ39313.1 sigma-54-dependent Fis family transcriptional regulator [Chlorobaculum thiosulfatiphilum]